jgi:hypothetical protein
MAFDYRFNGTYIFLQQRFIKCITYMNSYRMNMNCKFEKIAEETVKEYFKA